MKPDQNGDFLKHTSDDAAAPEIFRASTGYDIRHAFYPSFNPSAGGTVLFCGGQCTPLESYQSAISHYRHLGFNVLGVEWDTVVRSGSYFNDQAATLFDFIQKRLDHDPALPLIMAGHSQGCHVLSRLYKNYPARSLPDVTCNVFAAPMLRLHRSLAVTRTLAKINVAWRKESRIPVYVEDIQQAFEAGGITPRLLGTVFGFCTGLIPPARKGHVTPQWEWLRQAFLACEELTTPSYVKELKMPPTLIVCGEGDGLVCHQIQKELADVYYDPDNRQIASVILPDARHKLEGDKAAGPLWGAIANFLDGILSDDASRRGWTYGQAFSRAAKPLRFLSQHPTTPAPARQEQALALALSA